ncbi:MAG: M20/M25/M40 family metallo-hydrolase [bacterium]
MKLTSTEQLLLELLRRPSESGQEVVLATWLETRLAGRFLVERLPVDRERFNLLVRAGSVEPRKVLLAHIDTVPGQLTARVEPDRICGRGSCDNKGSVAAMITAVELVAEQGRQDFALLLTVGEETGCDGATAARREFGRRGWQPELVVVGEPTELYVVTAQKGVLAAHIICTGTEAHSSLPDPDSATTKLVELLHRLTQECPPDTTFNIGRLSGGVAANIVAGRAEASVSWRTSHSELRRQVEAAVASVDGCQLEIKLDRPPVDHSHFGFPHREVAFFSEMDQFENSLLCGPGSITQAHSENEFISRTELKRAVEVYRSFLES